MADTRSNLGRLLWTTGLPGQYDQCYDLYLMISCDREPWKPPSGTRIMPRPRSSTQLGNSKRFQDCPPTSGIGSPSLFLHAGQKDPLFTFEPDSLSLLRIVAIAIPGGSGVEETPRSQPHTHRTRVLAVWLSISSCLSSCISPK